jgi:hypothetical protein
MNDIDRLREEMNAKEHESMFEILKEIKDEIKGNLVTNNEFKPVQRVVYGMVGTIMIYVLGYFMTGLVKAVAYLT